MIEKTFQVNTISHFWTVKAFLPAMIKRNHGHIVTICSASAFVGVAGLCDYSASKWAAFGFDESLRFELQKNGNTGVRTTCVCPFFINTGMFEGVTSRLGPLMPILEPDYVASMIIRSVKRGDTLLCMPRLVSVFIARSWRSRHSGRHRHDKFANLRERCCLLITTPTDLFLLLVSRRVAFIRVGRCLYNHGDQLEHGRVRRPLWFAWRSWRKIGHGLHNNGSGPVN